MKFLSLFSGIEACSVAWKPLGWECVGFSEIEPYPCSLLAYHYPYVPNLGDITQITEQQIADLGDFDVLVFGSPCQDLSAAGTRKGFKDGTRSNLFYEALRIFDYARKHNNCRFALWENVPGAFSSNKGADFAAVVREMAGLKNVPVPPHGWGNSGVALGENGLLEWRVLDAQYFGLAQRRKRVFAIIDTGDWYDRPPILFERESVRGDTPPSREKGSEVTAAAETSVRECAEPTLAFQSSYNNVAVKEEITPPILAAQGTTGNKGVYVCHGSQTPINNTDELANCLGTNNGTENVVCFERRTDEVVRIADSGVSPTLRAAMGTSGTNHVNVAYTIHADPTPKVSEDVSGTLRSQGGGGIVPPSVVYGFDSKQQNASAIEEMAPTLVSSGYKEPLGVITGNIIGRDSANGGNQLGIYESETSPTLTTSDRHAVIHNYVVRRLTVTECERLQGFPDGYTDVPHNGKPASKSARYKALGNSIAVPVLEYIAKNIERAIMKPVVGYENVYSACASGEIFSHVNNKYLKGRPLPNMYLRVQLANGDNTYTDYLVHRLVCEAWHGTSDLHVNHIDAVKTNNRPSNLEWVTRSENMLHASNLGLMEAQSKRMTKMNVERCSISVVAIDRDGSVFRIFNSMSDAHRELNTNWQALKRAIENNTLYKGYYWKQYIGEQIMNAANYNNRTWDGIVADETEHQATKRLARPVMTDNRSQAQPAHGRHLMTQSPTSLQTFLTCPKQYHAKYITKEVKFEQNDHAIFGDLVHKSIENYLKHQEPLPTILHPLQSTLDKMGQVLYGAETKLAVDKQGNAVEFFDKSAYQRCIVDAIITNQDQSVVVCIDWKTGKKRDAQTQHDFIKKCAKAKFPNAKIVTLFLYFFVGKYDRQEYTGQELIALDRNMAKLASAYANDTFQPRPSGLCSKWCDVLSCQHNGKNK